MSDDIDSDMECDEGYGTFGDVLVEKALEAHTALIAYGKCGDPESTVTVEQGLELEREVMAAVARVMTHGMYAVLAIADMRLKGGRNNRDMYAGMWQAIINDSRAYAAKRDVPSPQIKVTVVPHSG